MLNPGLNHYAMDIEKTAGILSQQRFLGVPVKGFGNGGKEQLIYLLTAGLNPSSKIVDLGCGVLRAGYWLIHFLDPGCYCGIEPYTWRLEMGIKYILEPEVMEFKRPRFDTNSCFNTSVFGEKFNFFLAYSIWTHASKPQIRIMFDSFLRDSTDDGVFLTTYMPASWKNPDYQGDKWFGTSHQSEVPGCIYHSLRWIKAESSKRYLMVQDLGKDRVHGQSWLAIKRAM